MTRRYVWLGLAVLAVMALAVAVVYASFRPGRAGEVAREPVIVEGWAEATDVFLMDVPASCPAQRLEYRAWRRDPAQPAVVEFVAAQDRRTRATTGRIAVDDYAHGATAWSLPDDEVYALTARGVNARWRFAVMCD